MGTRRKPETAGDSSAVRWETVQTRRGESHRYRDTTTGRFISARQVRADIDRFVDAAGRGSARELMTALQSGRISLAEWQSGMARAVKNINYAAVASAAGGVQNMTAVERGRAGHIIRGQYEKLRQFAKDIESGKQPLDGRAMRRAEMYMDAARGAHHEEKRARTAAQHAGRTLMIRSRRNARDSCKSCIRLDGRWFKMGDAEYIPVGRRECLTSCRCNEEMGVMQSGGTIAALDGDGF